MQYFENFGQMLQMLVARLGSIFNTYHGAPILCCTTRDLGIFCVK